MTADLCQFAGPDCEGVVTINDADQDTKVFRFTFRMETGSQFNEDESPTWSRCVRCADSPSVVVVAFLKNKVERIERVNIATMFSGYNLAQVRLLEDDCRYVRLPNRPCSRTRRA